MNYVPLVIMYMASKLVGPNAQPLQWPGQKDPPPKRARKRHPHHKPHPDSPQADMKVGPVTVIKSKRGKHARRGHAMSNVGPVPHDEKPVHSMTNVGPIPGDATDHHTDSPVHHDAPPATDVEHHQQDTPLQLPDVYTVAALQSILRGLGWTGDNRMHTAMSPDLTDGDFGPVTKGNWMRSASKRGLNPIMERIDGQHARVDPETYTTLRNVARSQGANVSGRGIAGLRRGRVSGLYIP